jgi:hypothetical protein
VRDPLKGWTRKDAALADAFSIEQAMVDGTGFAGSTTLTGQGRSARLREDGP